MFDKNVYVSRRQTLLRKMREAGQDGLILFLGNAEAPAQYRDNCYKWPYVRRPPGHRHRGGNHLCR